MEQTHRAGQCRRRHAATFPRSSAGLTWTLRREVCCRAKFAALDAHLDDRMLNGATDKDQFFALVERARGRFAELIGADADEIAYTKNISEGLNIIATAIHWHRGENVVLCPELEHPEQRLRVAEPPALRRRSAHGSCARRAHSDRRARRAHGREDARRDGVDGLVRARFQDRRRNAGKACRERDVLLLVDAAQSVGVQHTDVRASNIDALAVSTQKGLLALYGMGYLYVRREWAERLNPAYLARFGVDLGDAHEASIGGYDFKLAPGARRFDLGNYNFLATAAVDASMKQLLEWDTRRIEPYVQGLTHALARGFLDLGLEVAGGEPGPHITKIVTVGAMSADHYGTGDERYNRLLRASRRESREAFDTPRHAALLAARVQQHGRRRARARIDAEFLLA